MIICSECGNAIADGMPFCSDCGASVPKTGNLPPQRTINSGGAGAGAAPAPYIEPPPFNSPANSASLNAPPPFNPSRNAPPPFNPPMNSASLTAPPPFIPPPATPPPFTATPDVVRQPETINLSGRSEAAPNSTKALIALISVVAVIAIGVAIYFALGSSPASKMATAMKSAVSNNQIVNTSNNDAYAYYLQLKAIDPTHPALKEAGQQVLPQLRNIGDEIFRRKALTNSEKSSDEDWARAQRACAWAHDIAPNDKQLEARWRFASGELAKAQKRLDEAERGFAAAAQVDSSWVLPQNSLGLLRSENRRWREAIPYYERAINLKPDWEIPYNNLGTAYFYLKDFDTAQSYYQRAAQANPNWARPHFWLGQIYQQRNWNVQAIEEYQKALQLDTNNYSISPNEADLIQKNLAKLQR